MIPDTEELPTGIAPEAPPIELERAPPKDADEAVMRYVAAVEKMQAGFGEFPPYYVEMTAWTGKMADQNAARVKLSTHVQIPRAMLKALLVMRGILREFEEDVG